MGLLHSAYSRHGFFFRYFDIEDPKSRAQVGEIVGADAEKLIYQYCSTWDEDYWVPIAVDDVLRGSPLKGEGYDMRSRIHAGQTEHRSQRELAKFLVGWCADVADQMCERFTYRDVYHHEEPELLWPGNGAPGTFLHWFSHLLKSIRPHLDVVPPVFNNCTEVIDMKSEIKARDLYWHLMQKEGKLTASELEDGYRKVCKLNPFVAEPHTMLSQILYKRGAFGEALHEACCALELHYQWATCWDKRHSFGQWVGFARMAVLRAKRRLASLESLPRRTVSSTAAETDTKVTYFQDLVKGFAETSGAQKSKL